MESGIDREILIKSASIKIKDCDTVCLALGPYRNLTTLTAATLFLHPNCQVLNHAATSVYGHDEVDFFRNYTKERFDRFMQYAIQISEGGKRGDFGGSIIHSHAFDAQYNMKDIFRKTGQCTIKKDIKSLFWKESLPTSKLIRENNIDLKKLLRAEPRLLFLMPVRNPMDCAKSNITTGLSARLTGINEASGLYEVLNAVLDELYWFFLVAAEFPDRFFHYFEFEVSRQIMLDLAKFLKLSPDEGWISNAQSAMIIKSDYQHDSSFIDFYMESVYKKFSRIPSIAKQLLTYGHDTIV